MEKPCVDKRIILKWIFKKWNREIWAGLIWLRRGTEDGLVNAIMNIRVPYNAGNFLTS